MQPARLFIGRKVDDALRSAADDANKSSYKYSATFGTAHSSKGLQFGKVRLHGFYDVIWYNKHTSENVINEYYNVKSLRVLFTAATRAQRVLVLPEKIWRMSTLRALKTVPTQHAPTNRTHPVPKSTAKHLDIPRCHFKKSIPRVQFSPIVVERNAKNALIRMKQKAKSAKLRHKAPGLKPPMTLIGSLNKK